MKVLIILGVLLFPSVACAAQLPLDQILQIHLALSQMNCGNKIIKDGTKETQVCDSYKWSTGLAWQIASNQRKTLDIVNQYNKVRNQLIAALPRKNDGEPTSEASAKFTVQDRELQEQTTDVALDHFKRSDLEPMSLPPSVISALWPIID